jgi:hypothetical protein
MSSATRYEYPRIDDAWKSYCIRRGKTRVRVSSWYRASVGGVHRRKKQILQVTRIEGKHVADFNAWNKDDPRKCSPNPIRHL